jgi:hypothetical protein
MKRILLIIALYFTSSLFGQDQKFVCSDIANFWTAFDKVSSTRDSVLQRKYIQELYLDQGSIGLKSLLEVRRYTAEEIVNVILKYPNFWSSIRKNSLILEDMYPEIDADISKLKKLYPDLKPSTIYFLMGAFRTSGTIQQDRVLIGCEYAIADENAVINEHSDARQYYYTAYQPKKNLGLLCTHEYIHTQQKECVDNLLSWCLYEGIAEYISCLATGNPSNSPAVSFGQANHEKVFKQFSEDVFFPNWNNWLWGENTNDLKERDLGYYIGYAISERYYIASSDKLKAIKELIELDYTNVAEVERIIDAAKVFPISMQAMWNQYNEKMPTVISIQPSNKKLKPGLVQLSITFSEPMDVLRTGFEYGPLGENHTFRFKRIIAWTNNDKTLTIEIEVDANKKYETYLTSNFRNKQDIRLQQYLIEFTTKRR